LLQLREVRGQDHRARAGGPGLHPVWKAGWLTGRFQARALLGFVSRASYTDGGRRAPVGERDHEKHHGTRRTHNGGHGAPAATEPNCAPAWPCRARVGARFAPPWPRVRCQESSLMSPPGTSARWWGLILVVLVLAGGLAGLSRFRRPSEGPPSPKEGPEGA